MMRPVRKAAWLWTKPIVIALASLVALIGALLTEDALLDRLLAAILVATIIYAILLGLRRPTFEK